jgi:glucose-6-phosphate 1-dehydrogenase
LFYLAIPPDAFETVMKNLARLPYGEGGRFVIEKPFGRDLASARELNRTVRSVFPEDAIFRIDHFLGKEEIMNLLYFRFANSFPEGHSKPGEVVLKISRAVTVRNTSGKAVMIRW